MLTHFGQLFDRDLVSLTKEIGQYPTDDSLWTIQPGIANSAGNLVLHLCGNLRHYIGFRLGGIDYQRNRPAEFSSSGLSRTHLVAEIDLARQAVGTLANLKLERLDDTYPEEVLGKPMTVGFFLIHLYGHLRYHSGQLNYHRRLVIPPSV